MQIGQRVQDEAVVGEHQSGAGGVVEADWT